jgi:hypothetical protein
MLSSRTSASITPISRPPMYTGLAAEMVMSPRSPAVV